MADAQPLLTQAARIGAAKDRPSPFKEGDFEGLKNVGLNSQPGTPVPAPAHAAAEAGGGDDGGNNLEGKFVAAAGEGGMNHEPSHDWLAAAIAAGFGPWFLYGSLIFGDNPEMAWALVPSIMVAITTSVNFVAEVVRIYSDASPNVDTKRVQAKQTFFKHSFPTGMVTGSIAFCVMGMLMLLEDDMHGRFAEPGVVGGTAATSSIFLNMVALYFTMGMTPSQSLRTDHLRRAIPLNGAVGFSLMTIQGFEDEDLPDAWSDEDRNLFKAAVSFTVVFSLIALAKPGRVSDFKFGTMPSDNHAVSTDYQSFPGDGDEETGSAGWCCGFGARRGS